MSFVPKKAEGFASRIAFLRSPLSPLDAKKERAEKPDLFSTPSFFDGSAARIPGDTYYHGAALTGQPHALSYQQNQLSQAALLSA